MKYKLKKEAVPFVNKKFATTIQDFEFWENKGIDINALEEVKPPYLSYGHSTEKPDYSTATLNGWSEKEGSRFCFTIHFPSMKYREHDVFNKEKNIRELMNNIQRTIDNHYSQFCEETGSID